MKNKLLIIGASGHGKVVADIALSIGKWDSVGFLDDNTSIKNVMGLDVVGTSKDLAKYMDEYDIFVAIGDNAIRKRVYGMLESLGASIPLLVHPSVVVGSDVSIDHGTVVMAGVIINCCTEIGRGCIINTGATVDHDNSIGDFVHISPGAHLAGTVEVGQECWLGIGSVISNNVRISSDCKVGAGSVVLKSISEPGTYVGIPVRRL